MDDWKWSYIDQCFKETSHSRLTKEIDEKMSPPMKKSKVLSCHAIEYPLEDLLEMSMAGLTS